MIAAAPTLPADRHHRRYVLALDEVRGLVAELETLGVPAEGEPDNDTAYGLLGELISAAQAAKRRFEDAESYGAIRKADAAGRPADVFSYFE